MPLSGVSVNNPQEQVSTPTAETGAIDVSYGGNALGSGAATATSASSGTELSTILLYGALGLGAVFLIKQFEK
jgi:hypothetical protein